MDTTTATLTLFDPNDYESSASTKTGTGAGLLDGRLTDERCASISTAHNRLLVQARRDRAKARSAKRRYLADGDVLDAMLEVRRNLYLVS